MPKRRQAELSSTPIDAHGYNKDERVVTAWRPFWHHVAVDDVFFICATQNEQNSF